MIHQNLDISISLLIKVAFHQYQMGILMIQGQLSHVQIIAPYAVSLQTIVQHALLIITYFSINLRVLVVV